MILWALRHIRNGYRRRQRELDLEHLWPSLKQHSDVERAKDAFALHCAIDPAWRDVPPDKIAELVTALS